MSLDRHGNPKTSNYWTLRRPSQMSMEMWVLNWNRRRKVAG